MRLRQGGNQQPDQADHLPVRLHRQPAAAPSHPRTEVLPVGNIGVVLRKLVEKLNHMVKGVAPRLHQQFVLFRVGHCPEFLGQTLTCRRIDARQVPDRRHRKPVGHHKRLFLLVECGQVRGQPADGHGLPEPLEQTGLGATRNGNDASGHGPLPNTRRGASCVAER